MRYVRGSEVELEIYVVTLSFDSFLEDLLGLFVPADALAIEHMAGTLLVDSLGTMIVCYFLSSCSYRLVLVLLVLLFYLF